jgi:8-oxo-dGTP pyrophosphatase MutT (NUDIX family)
MTAAPGLRRSSRVLLFDQDDRILLFLTKAPDTSGFARWITPGGGVDPGEDHHQAVIRELHEETGLVVSQLGGAVWSHDFEVTWDAADHDRGHAEFYVLHTTNFQPSSDGWTPEEHTDVLAHRWWTLDELLQTAEPWEPAELVDLIRHELNEPR